MFKTRKGLLGLIVMAAVMFGLGVWQLPQFSFGAPAISKQAELHILHGDRKGGGHLYGTGKPCKTEFPQDWDEAEILGNVRRIAANDNLRWKKQKNGYYVASDMIDDVKVRVVLDREKDGVVTAYPINGKPNACNTNSSKSAGRKAPSPANENTAQGALPKKTYNFNR